jgi:acyl-CoA thioesterase-1
MRGRRRWIGLVLAGALATGVVLALVAARLDPGTGAAACDEPPSGGGAVALGDSITIGSTPPRAEDSWFEQLTCTEDSPVEYAYNAGINGNTTAQMLARLERDVLSRDPDTVFILGGTNDLLGGIPPAETIANLRAIVEGSREAGADVYVGTIPPQEAVPLAAAPTEQLNAAIVALAEQLDVPVLDFHAALVESDGSYRDGLFADLVHPSAAGARVMARVARDALD